MLFVLFSEKLETGYPGRAASQGKNRIGMSEEEGIFLMLFPRLSG